MIVSQTLSHFFRQAKGRPQAAQTFVGRSALRRILAIVGSSARSPAACHVTGSVSRLRYRLGR